MSGVDLLRALQPGQTVVVTDHRPKRQPEQDLMVVTGSGQDGGFWLLDGLSADGSQSRWNIMLTDVRRGDVTVELVEEMP